MININIRLYLSSRPCLYIFSPSCILITVNQCEGEIIQLVSGFQCCAMQTPFLELRLNLARERVCVRIFA